MNALERKNGELRKANEILKAASAFRGNPTRRVRPDRSERVHRRVVTQRPLGANALGAHGCWRTGDAYDTCERGTAAGMLVGEQHLRRIIGGRDFPSSSSRSNAAPSSPPHKNVDRTEVADPSTV